MPNIDQPINVSAPADAAPNTDTPASAPVENKGKGKVRADDAMDEDEDEEDEEEDDDEDDVEDDDEMEGEEDFSELDAGAILPQGRRTRGVKIDYTSAEALKKAGLENGDAAKEEEDDEFVTQDNGVKAD